MKGEELYNLYCDVHADSVRSWDSSYGAYRCSQTAVAWPYLSSKEQKIWDETGARLGERRARKTAAKR